jgi:hypothetical protein
VSPCVHSIDVASPESAEDANYIGILEENGNWTADQKGVEDARILVGSRSVISVVVDEGQNVFVPQTLRMDTDTGATRILIGSAVYRSVTSTIWITCLTIDNLVNNATSQNQDETIVTEFSNTAGNSNERALIRENSNLEFQTVLRVTLEEEQFGRGLVDISPVPSSSRSNHWTQRRSLTHPAISRR